MNSKLENMGSANTAVNRALELAMLGAAMPSFKSPEARAMLACISDFIAIATPRDHEAFSCLALKLLVAKINYSAQAERESILLVANIRKH